MMPGLRADYLKLVTPKPCQHRRATLFIDIAIDITAAPIKR